LRGRCVKGNRENRGVEKTEEKKVGREKKNEGRYGHITQGGGENSKDENYFLLSLSFLPSLPPSPHEKKEKRGGEHRGRNKRERE